MKHLTRKLLLLVLTLATMGVLLTTALAAKTDKLTVIPVPEKTGDIVIDEESDRTFFVIAKVYDAQGNDVTDDYNRTFEWRLDDVKSSSVNWYELPEDLPYSEYTLTCTVTATHKTDRTTKEETITWNISFENVQNISLTISENLGEYYFTDDDTYSGTSVYDEIVDRLNPKNTDDLRKYVVTIVPYSSSAATFDGKKICALHELDDAHLSISSAGTWTAIYYVTLNNAEVLSGIITIEIERYVSMDAFYTALPGENVVIDADLFLKSWANEIGNYATFESVSITGCSGLSGTLCYNHSATEKTHTTVLGQSMYASPTKTQKGIEDLTFVPTKTSNKYPTGTLTISFVAKGKDAQGKSISYSGSVLIFYNETKPDTISYNATGTHVTFNSDDFDKVYRTVTGTTTKKPIYTIRFVTLPTYGTIYCGYSAANLGVYGSTALTSKNFSRFTFSSVSTGDTSLDSLAYVPTVHSPTGDSATYIVYSGTKILYVGTINFTSREFVVTYTMSTPTLNFSTTSFYTANSPLLNAQYISFGVPSSGVLYKDFVGGTRVQSYDYFSYTASYGVNLLDSVIFAPAENFLGEVVIPFSAQDFLGGYTTGKVRIYVVRDVFADVDPNNWAAPYINRLYATGIVKGTSNGSTLTFSPENNMKYGEALKMILIAAGYQPQNETGGTHWASGYLNLAFQKGIVASKNINLDAAVDRNTVAEIAAKALGMEAASSVNPGLIGPVDSTSGYVYALYNAGILNGSFVGGYNYFLGTNYITRAEVAKIICAINDYKK